MLYIVSDRKNGHQDRKALDPPASGLMTLDDKDPDPDDPDASASLGALWTSRVDGWYLREWVRLADREGMHGVDHEELRAGAKLIATNVARDGARLDALIRMDADAWSHAMSHIHDVIVARQPILDLAIEGVVRSVMASVTPAEAAAQEPQSTGATSDTPPYLFLSSIDDWIRLLAARAQVDDELRRHGQLIRARGRPIALRLLEEIARLPPMQRYAITLSAWRNDRRWLKEVLLDLAREASLEIPLNELFPLDIDQSVESDQEIAAYISSRGQRGKAANVAANRSVARRKLVRANPMYRPLLSSMLPYRKGVSKGSEEGDTLVIPDVDDQELERALKEAADSGARAFELLLQGSCARHQLLLPEFLRAERGTTGYPEHLAWRRVHAHTVACGRCRTILENEKLLSSKHDSSYGYGPPVRPLSKNVERIVVDLLRRGVEDRRTLLRLLTGLTEQAELRSETLQALAELAQEENDLGKETIEALARWRRHHPGAAPIDGKLGLPLELDASVTHSTRLRIVIAGASGEWGSLSREGDGIQLRLSGLPRVLNGKLLRFKLRYGDHSPFDKQEPYSSPVAVKQGGLTTTWDDLEERHLGQVVGLAILPPAPLPSQYWSAGNRLAARSRKARDEGRPLEALSYCYREIALYSSLPKTRQYAETERRTGAICLELGRLGEAGGHMRKALQTADQIEERRVVCDALRGLGEIYTRQANWSDADDYLSRALEIAKQLTKADRVGGPDGERRIASILTSRGSLLLDQGLEEAGQAMLDQALDVFGKSDDKIGSAAALNVRALAQRRAGAHGDAFRTCEQARALLKTVKSIAQAPGSNRTKPEARVRRLEAELKCTEGRLHHAEGNTDDAMSLFRESLELMYEVGHRSGEGDAISAIGRVYEALGDTDAALRSLRRGQEIFAETGDEFRRSAILGTLARVSLSKAQQSTGSRRIELIERAIGEAIESLECRATDRGRAITLTVLAKIYVEWSLDDPGHRKDARRYYTEAIDLRKTTVDHRGLAATLTSLAEFELMLEDHNAAKEHLEESLKYFKEIPNPRGEAAALGLLADVLESEDRFVQAHGARASAVALVEQVRAGISDGDLRRRYFGTSVKHHRELARMLALDHPLEALILAEASRGRVLLEYATRADTPILYSEESDKPWREGIRAVGVSGVAALSYLITDKGSFVFVISSEGVSSERLEVEPDELKKQTRQLIEAVAEGSPSYPHGESLYRALVEPVMERLGGCHQLIVSPDEPIADLPFELLLTARPPRAWAGGYLWGDKMPYLLEQMAIVTVPTIALHGLVPHRQVEPKWTILAPATLSEAQRGWLDALFSQSQEDDHMVGSFELVEGRDATLLAAGEVVGEQSMSVLLVIADSLIEDDDVPLAAPTALIFGDDEPWVADEIANRESTVDLVVLGADGAANGSFVPGEGTYSLGVAFLMSGARAVCASALPVPASAEVLPFMLEKVLEGRKPAKAMQEAQLEMSGKGSHPLLWSGWKVMGVG
jgi:tetratricopeptide (TPR) repeat protein/CHAT domain-containing protein